MLSSFDAINPGLRMPTTEGPNAVRLLTLRVLPSDPKLIVGSHGIRLQDRGSTAGFIWAVLAFFGTASSVALLGGFSGKLSPNMAIAMSFLLPVVSIFCIAMTILVGTEYRRLEVGETRVELVRGNVFGRMMTLETSRSRASISVSDARIARETSTFREGAKVRGAVWIEVDGVIFLINISESVESAISLGTEWSDRLSIPLREELAPTLEGKAFLRVI